MNKLNQTLFGLLSIAACVAISSGCSHSVKKAEYSQATNPTEEVGRLEQELNEARASQVDVLATQEFRAAEKSWSKAKDQMASGKSQENVLDSLGYAKAYLMRAKEVAAGRADRVAGILEARNAALKAGAREFPAENEKLVKIDSDLNSLVDDKVIHPDHFADMQKRYMDLELTTVQARQLGTARANIDHAIREGARKAAPVSLNRAETQFKDAENAIATDRRNVDSFRPAVERANNSASILAAVMAEVKRANSRITEDSALQIVMKDRQIASMNSAISQDQKRLNSQGQQLAAKDQALNASQAQLTEAEAQVRLKNALESARKEFSPNEAQVFTQGDRMIIRLTSVGFSSGKADLPEKAVPLMEKVKAVAASLGAQQVVVEGHTDATGSPEVNSKLSQKRAESVKNFLVESGIENNKVAAVGYGNERPVSSNKTKEGRAQNRRVDVVILPEGSSEPVQTF